METKNANKNTNRSSRVSSYNPHYTPVVKTPPYEHFVEVESKNERNKATVMAYKDGYKQVENAQYLGLSKSHVAKVLKEVEI